jgi:hypothetical protein
LCWLLECMPRASRARDLCAVEKKLSDNLAKYIGQHHLLA